MKNSKIIYLTLAGVLVLIITAGALYAGPLGKSKSGNREGDGGQKLSGKTFGGDEEKFGGIGTGMLKKLKLTEDQKAEVKSIIESHKASIKPLRESVQDARLELKNLITSDDVDDDAIRDAVHGIADIQADIMVEVAHIRKEIRGILTEEQLQVLADAKENRREKLEGVRDRLDKILESYE